jgi:tRNA pseudouridine55 synthase
MARLTGEIDQVPSAVSAIKVGGMRAYARVRGGETVDLPARPVTVTCFSVTAPPRRQAAVVDVDVAVDCSTGTYVRALARDLGGLLGVGGHVTALRRETIGSFAVRDAVDVYPGGMPRRGRPGGDIAGALRDRVAAAVIDTSEAARTAFAGRDLDRTLTADLRHGRPIPAAGIPGVYAGFDPAGGLVALLSDDQGAARPVFVWQAAG